MRGDRVKLALNIGLFEVPPLSEDVLQSLWGAKTMPIITEWGRKWGY